jgi:hypothetical protein
LPHDVVINAKVVVHDLVAHPDDVRPSDVRMVIAELSRNLPRGLDDGLDQMNQGEAKVLIVRLWDVETGRRLRVLEAIRSV